MLTRSPRALLLWTAAVGVAVATGAVVASDLAALHQRARAFGEERDAVVAQRDLPVGATIEADDVRVRRIHTSQLPPGVLRAPDRAAGRVVTTAVLRGGFVARRNLAPSRRTGLDGVLPEGSRAMRVVVSDAVRPRVGAGIDVLATFGTEGLDREVDEPDEAVTIADGALVLRVDDARTHEGGTGIGVTVLVTPREARELAFAVTHGVVAIALVPPEAARSP